MEVEVTKVYSFAERLGQGNPAGVVFDQQELSSLQMMKISEMLHVSETAFLLPSDEADYHVRFFSPTCEVDLCGHATIAAFTLVGRHHIKDDKESIQFIQNTRAGTLHVHCYYGAEGLTHVMMEQQEQKMDHIGYDDVLIAQSLNISNESLTKDLPKMRVSTGLFTLPICVDSLNTLRQMKPNFKHIKTLCEQYNVGSFHVFTFETLDESSVYHARNFAPCYGINEDPVTGTANGAVCSYLKDCNKIQSDHVVCEQGDIINRAGRVTVDLSQDHVWVGGQAIAETSQTVNV